MVTLLVLYCISVQPYWIPCFFFLNKPAPPEISPFPLPPAFPISSQTEPAPPPRPGGTHESQIVPGGGGGGERMPTDVGADPGCAPAVSVRIRRELHDLLALS